MPKKESTLWQNGMAQPTLATYYLLVLSPPGIKNQEKSLENKEEIVFLAETNDSSNGIGSNTTHTIRPEKAINTGTNMVPADDMQ